MAKIVTRQDDVFGTLTHVVAGLWQRMIELQLLGRNWIVPMHVGIGKKLGKPEPNQVAAYKTFTENRTAILLATETAIIELYDSVARSKSKSTMRAIEEAVQLQAVTFPYVCRKPTFGFLFQCDWEREHGLGVKFEDGELTEVGLQDILL